MVAGGFTLTAYAWRILYVAQRDQQLARAGPYSLMRHPQYVGFTLVMLGLFLVWTALSTLIMFPVMMLIYIRLARREEQAALDEFGDEYRHYRAVTPAFVPRFSRAVRA